MCIHYTIKIKKLDVRQASRLCLGSIKIKREILEIKINQKL